MDEALPSVEPDVEGAARPPASIRWLARLMSALCWLGIAFGLFGAAVGLFNLDSQFIDRTEGGANDVRTLISFHVALADPAANTQALVGLREDILHRIGDLASVALYVWALLSARRSFVGVGRGEYFARPTILGLRNLALAVLLYHTMAPLLEIIPRALYFARIKGDRMAELSFSFGFNEQITLMLVFAGAVALVSSVMAHAAKIADENRQFV